MKAHYLMCSVAALSLALVAGGQSRAEARTTAGESGSEKGQTVIGGNLSSEDREFLKEAAEGGLAEVALGTIAAQKATAPEVKRFGNRMVTDHSRANEELKSIAARKGITLPTELSRKHRDQADELSKLSGRQFDEAYAKAMVEDHESDVDAFETASKETKDADFKAWATKTLPILKEHLQLAKQMQSNLTKKE